MAQGPSPRPVHSIFCFTCCRALCVTGIIRHLPAIYSKECNCHLFECHPGVLKIPSRALCAPKMRQVADCQISASAQDRTHGRNPRENVRNETNPVFYSRAGGSHQRSVRCIACSFPYLAHRRSEQPQTRRCNEADVTHEREAGIFGTCVCHNNLFFFSIAGPCFNFGRCLQ